LTRLVIVSNRVASSTEAKTSVGGLAVAVRAALKKIPTLWFGWSGNVIDGMPHGAAVTREGNLTRAVLDLPSDLFDQYYAGFSNRSLWPLFHYRIDLTEFDCSGYPGYLKVNELFARNLAPMLREDDIIWVHDYHLIPLAAALRKLGVKQRIGFFLHIPFPEPETLTTLPLHEAIVKALAAYDLVGFQTDGDMHAFESYIEKETDGTIGADGDISVFGRRFRAGAFPISIDTAAVEKGAAKAEESSPCKRLRESIEDRKLIIGVDRLDYTKGLVQRFAAIERFLADYPNERPKTVFLQIAPPSRSDVPEYQQIRAALDALAGDINGRFAEFDRAPVRYIKKQFAQETLFGFYRLSAAGLVTPLRDGMNLVAKEFVASQDPDDPGVLVLSRFAGAAHEMPAALIVNPYDAAGVAQAIHRALAMPLKERRSRHADLMQVLSVHDINAWREKFLAVLSGAPSEGEPAERPAPPRSRTPSFPSVSTD
jgi:trehalose 6-phosphate synthase